MMLQYEEVDRIFLSYDFLIEFHYAFGLIPQESFEDIFKALLVCSLFYNSKKLRILHFKKVCGGCVREK